MKFSEKWLREWVNPSLTTQQLSHTLTMAGLEVESIEETKASDDSVFEIDLTPNRGDCLSIQGIAREVGVLTGTVVTELPEVKTFVDDESLTWEVEVKAVEDCPRYVGRLIQGCHLAKTPSWLVERLEKSSIGCIHPIVDILNYVMLELGQPMHAFDADKLKGAIKVRHAKAGEKITLLDKQEIILKANTLIIADQNMPLAIAGVMGGLDCAVTENTQNVFLESAFFTPHLMAGKARLYGLHTDSAFRFERGVDSALQVIAIERASALIQEICGGKFGPIVDRIHKDTYPRQNPILLHYDRLKKLLGHPVTQSTVIQILHALGCELLENEAPEHDRRWLVIPPSFRLDIVDEVDLIEEVVRVYGYDNIPSTMPLAHLRFLEQSQKEVPLSRMKRALVDMGYQEVITYSFVHDSLQKMLFPTEEPLALLNPISADMNVMRVSLWPGLLNTLQYNQNRQQGRMKIFETGLCFLKREGECIQEEMIAGLVSGEASLEHWDLKSRPVDFFDVKQTIESLWRMIGQTLPLTFTASHHPACHPGQSAVISFQEAELGMLVRLHPRIEKALSLNGPVFLFSLNTQSINQAPLPVFERPSRFPEIRRDIAIIVDEKWTSDALINHVATTAGDLLQSVKVFDVYKGKGIEPGSKSIAMGLVLQHSSRTLVDEEVDGVIKKIVSGLEQAFNAKLRD